GVGTAHCRLSCSSCSPSLSTSASPSHRKLQACLRPSANRIEIVSPDTDQVPSRVELCSLPSCSKSIQACHAPPSLNSMSIRRTAAEPGPDADVEDQRPGSSCFGGFAGSTGGGGGFAGGSGSSGGAASSGGGA